MNAPTPVPAQPAPQTVTTGPIQGSRKVYAAPVSHPDIKVPFREIVLTDANEPPVRVYDPSGPYTEADARIDLAKGLPQVREAWVAARGFEAVQGRAVKPEDNGDVGPAHLVPHCPAERTLRRARPARWRRNMSLPAPASSRPR